MEQAMVKAEHPLESITINKEVLEKLQGFQKLLQKAPDPKEIRKNKFANDSEYLPISFLEMTLDELFFGLWQTKNFHSRTVANEEVGDLEVWFFHPTAMTWLSRVGTASVMIQYEAEYEVIDGKKQKIKTNITDISKKIINTLTKDYPHLKAECFRNACKSIGKAFGRDLNREFEDQYSPIIREVKEPTEEERKAAEEKRQVIEISRKIIDKLDTYKGKDRDTLKSECAKKLKANTATSEYLQGIATKIGVEL